jgi:hypothetical protein
MASFISELSQALGCAIAARIRNSERPLARGEVMALATVLEIASQVPDQNAASEGQGSLSWDWLERMAKGDLELVKRARGR